MPRRKQTEEQKPVAKRRTRKTTAKSTKKETNEYPERRYDRNGKRKDGRGDLWARRETIRLDCDGNPIKMTEQERRRPGKAGHLAWQAPEDMPDKMVVQVMAGKMCGAKTRSGTYCKSRHVLPTKSGLAPFRCRLHGGLSSGPPLGTQNRVTHGLYCKAILPGEEDAWDMIRAGELEEEIRITKLRLRRAINFEAELERRLAEGEDVEDQMVIESSDEKVAFGMNGESYRKMIRRLPDVKRIIHDVVTQLVKLENQRTIMQQGSAGLTPEEQAAKARDFIKEAKQQMLGDN